MKRKITRMDLVGLSRNYYVLSREEMKSKMGRGEDGNPPGFGFTDAYENYFWYRAYSQEDFINWTEPWYGGWVEGWGYVAPEIFVYGRYTIFESFYTVYPRYDFTENHGFKATYSTHAYTTIENGLLVLTASGTNVSNLYNMCGNAEIFVNGKSVALIPLNRNGANLYSKGDIPLGSISINLRNYHGFVEVYLKTGEGRGDSYTSYSGTGGGLKVYEGYR